MNAAYILIEDGAYWIDGGEGITLPHVECDAFEDGVVMRNSNVTIHEWANYLAYNMDPLPFQKYLFTVNLDTGHTQRLPIRPFVNS